MFAETGLGGNKTNHSLRVTGASALFDAGVPERIIQSRTGHRSLDALRVYERVTDAQSHQVSKILSGNKKTFTDKAHDTTPSEASLQELEPLPAKQAPGTTQYNNCTINTPVIPSHRQCNPQLPMASNCAFPFMPQPQMPPPQFPGYLQSYPPPPVHGYDQPAYSPSPLPGYCDSSIPNLTDFDQEY